MQIRSATCWQEMLKYLTGIPPAQSSQRLLSGVVWLEQQTACTDPSEDEAHLPLAWAEHLCGQFSSLNWVFEILYIYIYIYSPLQVELPEPSLCRTISWGWLQLKEGESRRKLQDLHSATGTEPWKQPVFIHQGRPQLISGGGNKERITIQQSLSKGQRDKGP